MILSYLRRERARLRFFRALETFFKIVVLVVAFYEFFLWSRLFLFATKFPSVAIIALKFLEIAIGIFVLGFILIRTWRALRRINLTEAASHIEAQSKFFRSSIHRSELTSAASFLDSSNASDFERKHIDQWSARLKDFQIRIRPNAQFGIVALIALSVCLSSYELSKRKLFTIPRSVFAWAPSEFQSLLPYPGAQWKKETGALGGFVGTRVRFGVPSRRGLKTFLFVSNAKGEWSAQPCEHDRCEMQLMEHGQYAIGTLFARSPFFPLEVTEDEPPKSVLFAIVNGERIPSAALEITNQKFLPLEGSASDDLRLTNVELHHRAEDRDSILQTWTVNDPHFEQSYSLSLEGWSGGKHELFLRSFDDFKSADSAPITILFQDEKTLRAKRLQDLNAAINDWLYVLSSMLEANEDQHFPNDLTARLEQIHYPDSDEGLVSAYVKELKLLSQRIDSWAKSDGDLKKLPDLISRVEKEILYGLSLIFQEKTGEVDQTADGLRSSKDEIQAMLQKIKDGKMDFSSKELQDAFERLGKQLEDLQSKIKNLPQGPSDDLMNRQALDKDLEESNRLSDRIDEIKKQMAAGDNKGALRELESLMNQLAILSKEMERSLDQFKQNLDQGAMQAVTKHMKDLEAMKKREDQLAERSKKLKEDSEKLESQSQTTWKPTDPKILHKLQQQMKMVERDQKNLQSDFEKNNENYDKALEGSEFEKAFRGEQTKDLEGQTKEEMSGADDALREQRVFDAQGHEQDASEKISQLIQSQKQMQQQIEQSAGQQSASGAERESNEKIEILSSEAKDQKERRRKIMDSLRQKVDDRYQKSHEHYFEELLQR